MRKSLILLVTLLCGLSISAKDYTVTSPDGRLSATVTTGGSTLSWSVDIDGQCVLAPSPMAMDLADGTSFGRNAKPKKASVTLHEQVIPTPIYRRASVDDRYNQLTLDFIGYALNVRAYDDGAAYRFVADRKGKLTVAAEVAEFNFPDNYPAYVPYVNDNRSGERYTYSFESFYDKQRLASMYADSLAVTPLLVDEGKYKVAVSDFGALDYPGMFVKGNGNNGLVAEFAPVPMQGTLAGFNTLNFIPTLRADYIAADVEGKRTFPWRAVIVASDDTQLADNDMAVRLAQPSQISDLSWIKPGKVAWDWWNNLHIYGVDFKVGRNTQTYKYFVDFARDNALEYIIVDEGWSDPESLMTTVGDIDINELVEYGLSQGVGVILWASWKNMHRQLQEAMSHYANMGVAGFKIDFFDADDQNMMRDMEAFAQTAAEHHLLLDYHGMKANGMHVTYPNLLNYEGVKGLENYRWSSIENDPPAYAVTIPYIRTLIGPMDYTPGAMLNANTAEHRADGANPMSEGTRANQVAMYVVYDAPLQMLADSPSRYKDNQHCTDFIARIPTTYDDTKILDGNIGKYIVTARRAGDTWYVGAMTNREARDLTIDLSFLPAGEYMMEVVDDGINTNIDARDHRHTQRRVTNTDAVSALLSSAGGWAAIITPMQH